MSCGTFFINCRRDQQHWQRCIREHLSQNQRQHSVKTEQKTREKESKEFNGAQEGGSYASVYCHWFAAAGSHSVWVWREGHGEFGGSLPWRMKDESLGQRIEALSACKESIPGEPCLMGKRSGGLAVAVMSVVVMVWCRVISCLKEVPINWKSRGKVTASAELSWLSFFFSSRGQAERKKTSQCA